MGVSHLHCRSPPGTPFHVAVAPASSSPTDSQPCREDKHLIDIHTSHIQTPHNKPPLSWKGTHVYSSETLVLVVAPCPEEPALQLSSWPFASAASNPSTPSGWWWLPHGDQFSVALATELASLSPPASWAGTRERKGEGRGRGRGGEGGWGGHSDACAFLTWCCHCQIQACHIQRPSTQYVRTHKCGVCGVCGCVRVYLISFISLALRRPCRARS